MVFHIDEDAYVKLSRYFEAIKKQLSDSDGKAEIMNDIEIRISELFSEKLKSDKQVISMRDLDEVIAIMGEPQDYRLDDEEPVNQNYTAPKNKKLYRDTDEGILGGVLSGLAHYWGIDKVWLRVIALALFFFYGIGLIPYIILWCVMPEAKTTSEKLEMKGEAVNISSIEKKVREEFDNFSEKVNNIDYEKYKNKAQAGAKNLGNSVSGFFLGLFKIIGKIIGIFIILFTMSTLFSLLFALIALGSTEFFQLPWTGISEAFNYSEVPVWILAILFLFAIGIPLIGLFILGLKMLISNSKSLNNTVKYTLFGLWFVSVIALAIVGVRQLKETAFEQNVSETQYVNVQPNDTLHINMAGNPRFENSNRYKNFKLVLDENEKEIMYSNNIKLNIQKTRENQPYVVIKRLAGGNSLINAKKRAEEIRYNFIWNENQLIFDDYLLIDLKSKFRNQEVKIEVFIPENQVFFIDENIDKYWGKFYLEFKVNHTYIFEGNSYRCLDCITEKEEPIEEPTTENDTISVVPQQGRLEVGSDGTIINTSINSVSEPIN